MSRETVNKMQSAVLTKKYKTIIIVRHELEPAKWHAARVFMSRDEIVDTLRAEGEACLHNKVAGYREQARMSGVDKLE